MFSNAPSVIPMRLTNDNLWGYVDEAIYKYNVRFLEMAIVSPAWTNMVVYYVEGDYGHLLNEFVHRKQFRTVARGAPISFQLPWEDILRDLQKNVSDKDLLELPRTQTSLQYFL